MITDPGELSFMTWNATRHMASAEADTFSSEAMALTHEERQSLMDAIDASLRINQRHQFFSWSQGLVQSLLPHEILICGISTNDGKGMRMAYFSSSRYFNDIHFAAVCHPDSGLLPHLMMHWQNHGRPCMVGEQGQHAPHQRGWLEAMRRHEMRNAVIHGTRGVDGTIKSFFCISRVPEPFVPRLIYFLEILTPFMDATISRVLAAEEHTRRAPRGNITITAREVQILRWIRDGHTNMEIAAQLAISPHTVKNHVRKILGKLGVQSRGQAAVKAIQIGVLKIYQD